MKTYHFHIEGQVQGVGFRPFVHRLGKKYGLNGRVSNDVDGVHIWVNEEENESREQSFKILDFIMEIQDAPPKNSIITEVHISREDHPSFEGFNISKKSSEENPKLLLTPDLGLCEDCRSELNVKKNRRNEYPFITCTNCGPRYSIIGSLPYDRERTSMTEFHMCPDCVREYEDTEDRRFYSQTNSCKTCGIQLRILNKEGTTPKEVQGLVQSELIEFVVKALKAGKIIAAKGIGGYLLLADATNSRAIRTLRERKKRPSKPFALLYPSIEAISRDVSISKEELESLESVQNPIVLLKRKENTGSKVQTDLIAPGLSRLGCFLPYSGLLEMISNSFSGPLIATSGNFSGSPIYFKDKEAVEGLKDVADYFLCHDLEIKIPQDDSLISHSYWTGKKIFHRRSRGYAPNLMGGFPAADGLLAMGAMMKSCIGITSQGYTYSSQYLGNTENYDVQRSYEQVLDHLRTVLQFDPKKILVDLHPDYFTPTLGEQLSKVENVSLEGYQHHEAHFAAVLGENELLDTKEPILGVVWDGTGYGHDGQIWGGEFFEYKMGKTERVSSIFPYMNIGGDRMSTDPKLPALSLLYDSGSESKLLGKAFPAREFDFLTKALIHGKGLKTSSIGRLFDASACVLGFHKEQSFEGEAALFVQELAEKELTSAGGHFADWPLDELDPKALISLMLEELKNGLSKEKAAAKFHLTLVRWIRNQAKNLGIKSIAFSGGVFQNSLLVDLIIMELQRDHKLYFHKQLSPNDECIPYGQIILETLKQRSGIQEKSKSKQNF